MEKEQTKDELILKSKLFQIIQLKTKAEITENILLFEASCDQ
jgi:hypothetical protein